MRYGVDPKGEMDLRIYQVWGESYELATVAGPTLTMPTLHGTAKANSFQAACDALFMDDPHYDAKELTWHGRKLCPTFEEAANRSSC